MQSLRKSDQDVAEQADLHAAYECMKDVCDYVNEMKRDHETIEFINTVDGSINSLDLVSFDQFIIGNPPKFLGQASWTKSLKLSIQSRIWDLELKELI